MYFRWICTWGIHFIKGGFCLKRPQFSRQPSNIFWNCCNLSPRKAEAGAEWLRLVNQSLVIGAVGFPAVTGPSDRGAETPTPCLNRHAASARIHQLWETNSQNSFSTISPILPCLTSILTSINAQDSNSFYTPANDSHSKGKCFRLVRYCLIYPQFSRIHSKGGILLWHSCLYLWHSDSR